MNVTPKSEPRIPRVEPAPPLGAPPAAARGKSGAGSVVLALLALAAMGAFVVYRTLHRNEALQESVAELGGRPAVRVVTNTVRDCYGALGVAALIAPTRAR